MDIIQILNAIKGKVLDVAHFDMLKNAYELQNQNIEQLKNNNAALKESNSLIKEKINNLEIENDVLKRRVTSLEDDLHLKKNTDPSRELSEFAKAILRHCIQEDETEFWQEDIVNTLKYSRMQLESGIDELRNLEFIVQSYVPQEGLGSGYSLTAEGKKLALKISPEEKS